MHEYILAKRIAFAKELLRQEKACPKSVRLLVSMIMPTISESLKRPSRCRLAHTGGCECECKIAS